MGAVQAQDYGAAKWALAQRTSNATDASIEQALIDGTILRTHVLRPTWHLVAPSDIRWMLELSAPRIRALMAHYDRKLGLDDAVCRASNRVIAKALAGGEQTRAELADVLTCAGIDATDAQRLGNLMIHAELDGVICSGPRRGKQFTYALLDARAPNATSLPRDDALAELATRYFTTRGPATIQDFAWWSGLALADAIRGAESALGPLKRETIGSKPYWSGANEAATKGASTSAQLLPNFDELFVAYKDRGARAPLTTAAGRQPCSPALTDNAIILGGHPVGSWKRTVSTKGIMLATSTIRSLTSAEHARISKQAKRYATFLGAPIHVHTNHVESRHS